jgi:hypothetical protein
LGESAGRGNAETWRVSFINGRVNAVVTHGMNNYDDDK